MPQSDNEKTDGLTPILRALFKRTTRRSKNKWGFNSPKSQPLGNSRRGYAVVNTNGRMVSTIPEFATGFTGFSRQMLLRETAASSTNAPTPAAETASTAAAAAAASAAECITVTEWSRAACTCR